MVIQSYAQLENVYGKATASIVMDNCKELGKRIEEHILAMRGESKGNESYILPINQVRFSNGEGKVSLANSVRGKDIFIVSDVGNYSCTYRMFGQDTMIGPDEHFQDIKRVLSAIGGKANRITVVMPLLYASRQHRRKGRESLDCAMALKELENLGVDAIITFDVHDPNIHNAIPNCSFENILPTYSILKSFMNTEGPETREKLTVISPDTGAMDRAIFYASVLGVDVGMFYKRRDHTRIVNGKNPIVEHKYIGGSLKDYNVLIVDDMIASGESVVDIISKIQRYKVLKRQQDHADQDRQHFNGRIPAFKLHGTPPKVCDPADDKSCPPMRVQDLRRG